MDSSVDDRPVIGIDLHRRRSVLVRLAADGQQVGRCVRIANDVPHLLAQLAGAGEHPRVVLEATYGWYWAVDALQEAGAEVHLAHPLGVRMFALRRVKNDERDAHDLADLLRLGRLPEAWIADRGTRGLRELVRYRHQLVAIRTGCKNQVHAVLGKCGVRVEMSDLFGPSGIVLLDALELAAPFHARVASLRRVIAVLDAEIGALDASIGARLADDVGYHAVQVLPGVGPVLAAVFVAEIGDITRFQRPEQLCCWAGLTPRHRESDNKVSRGRITKQGSRLLRWAAIEAVQRSSASAGGMREIRDRIVERRGPAARNIGKVAAARKLLTLVFYGLRDGQIRALARPVPGAG
jgi:transposase